MKPVPLAAVALATLLPTAVLAQDAPAEARAELARRAARNTIPANSLATIVEKLNWDPARNGVLLLVGPEKLRTQGSNPMANMMAGFDIPEGAQMPGGGIPDALKPPPIPAPGPNGYRLDAIAGLFKRKLVRTGGLSTLAPIDVAKAPQGMEQMMEGMEEFMGADKEPALMAFLSTLSAAQWSAAISDLGLGREGLDAAQTRLFESLLPAMAELKYPKGKAPAPPTPPSPEQMAKIFAGGAPDPEALKAFLPPTLPPEQLATLRLRLRRDLAAVAVRAPKKKAGNDTADAGIEGFPIAPKGQDDAWDDSSIFLKLPPMLASGGLGMLTGLMNQREPAFPKKSDVNYQASGLQTAVPLNGLKTVGDLVERVAKTAGVPIVCDRRYAALSVHIRGESALAGDLLQALTRAVHGSVRRLGEGDDQLYLVTDDIVPGARRSAGQMDAMMKVFGPMANRRKAAVVEGKLARVRLAARNPLAGMPRGRGTELPEALWQAAEAGKKDVVVPLIQLPEAYQAGARDMWNEMDLEVKSTQLPPDSARGAMSLVAELVVGATGAFTEIADISADSLRPDANVDQPVPPLKWPDTFPTRAAFVNVPTEPAVRDALVAALAARGFTHVFAEAPLGGDLSGVAALAEAAKAKGLRVVPSLAPLHGEARFPGAPRDISANGETARQWATGKSARDLRQAMPFLGLEIERLARADFLIPEVVDPIQIAGRLETLAKLPGVSSVALFDLAPPGYSPSMGTDGFFWAGGATLGARRNFVRAEKMDPADLSTIGFDLGAMLEGGGMLDSRQAMQVNELWQKALAKRRDGFVTRIDTAVKRASLGVPLMNLSTGILSTGIWEPWTGTWNAVEFTMGGDDEMPVRKKPDPKAKKPIPGDRLLFVRPSEFYTEGFNEEDIDDPHLLRPDEERLAAWIGEKVGAAVPSQDAPAPAEHAHSALANPGDGDDEPERWTGFVLDLTDLTPVAAAGFLERRVAVQEVPAPKAPEPLTVKEAPVKPKPVPATKPAPAPKPRPRRR